jgi:hypothetical protein
LSTSRKPGIVSAVAPAAIETAEVATQTRTAAITTPIAIAIRPNRGLGLSMVDLT